LHSNDLVASTGVKGSVMMLAYGNMRVSHVSTHVALQDVPKRLTPDRLRYVIDLTDKALRGLGLERPKIAVAALNPHAGEGGLFGRQDIDIAMYHDQGHIPVKLLGFEVDPATFDHVSFLSILVFIPREKFDTNVRTRVADFLVRLNSSFICDGTVQGFGD
jgi:4-hydroxy-L-threonine phosphate dehydrogenase PdxA